MRHGWYSAVCVLLLLVSQFAALTHALSHVTGRISGHEAAQSAILTSTHVHHGGAHDGESPSGQSALCVFDLAFGQVLGGVHASVPPLLAVASDTAPVPDVPTSRLRAEALSPKSRGPPVLL